MTVEKQLVNMEYVERMLRILSAFKLENEPSEILGDSTDIGYFNLQYDISVGEEVYTLFFMGSEVHEKVVFLMQNKNQEKDGFTVFADIFLSDELNNPDREARREAALDKIQEIIDNDEDQGRKP